MTTRVAAILTLATTVAASATVLAADDHWPHDVDVPQMRHIVHDVHQVMRETLREARLEIRAVLREVWQSLDDAGAQSSRAERAERRAERARVREARAQSRADARDVRDRERQARAFRQVSPTDDPCARNRGNDDRGHACEVRDTRFAAPGSPLSVDATPNGGIRVEGWDEPDVLVRAVVQAWGDDDAEAREVLTGVRVTAAGAGVSADGPARPDGRRRHGWSVSYRIWAPRQTALDLVARNGGVSIHGMHGDTRFTTTNGGVTLDEVAGRFVGKTSNGGVNVRLAGARWEGAGLDVETTNGGVTLTVPRDYSAALEIGTVNGGLRSDLPVTLPGGRGRSIRTTLGSGGPLIKVQTVNGGVRLAAR